MPTSGLRLLFSQLTANMEIMGALIRFAPAILYVVLVVYGLVSLWLTPARRVRIFPRWTWFLLIVLLPIVGPLTWIVAGTDKPQQSQTPPPAPKAPDDDPDFLAKLAHEQQLQSWEDDLLEWELKRMQKEKEDLDKKSQGNKRPSERPADTSGPEEKPSPQDAAEDPDSDQGGKKSD